MKPHGISRSSITMNSIWKVRGRRPTLRRTCKVYIPRDLRELDTLRLPATYEEDHFLVQKLKAFTKHKMHHWILVAVISFYLYAGALLFQYLESHCKTETAVNVTEKREHLLNEIYNASFNLIEKKDEWVNTIKTSIQLHESTVLQVGNQGTAEGEKNIQTGWSIQTSVFYCLTVITTIGYGDISPCTNTGRAVTTIYAAMGVPLMFLVLADLGKLFTKVMKYVFLKFRRFYNTGTFKLNASPITEGKPLQYMTVSWRTVKQDNTPNEISDDSSVKKTASSDQPCNQVTTLTIHNDDLYKNLDFLNPDEKNHKHVEVEDEFNLPISLAIAFLAIYMIAGGLLFSHWEDWTFFEAFYFVFISMTTIGLGDYTPQHQEYMMAAFAYIVLGLMLSSMCINVIQEKISAAFQKARVRIGNNTVLNVNSLLEDEDHRSRTPKYDTLDPQRNNNCYAFKMTLHRDSMGCAAPSVLPQMKNFRLRSPTRKLSDSELKSDFGKEMFLKIPFQNRFTFYDSPYSTIQDESQNTQTSINRY